MTESIFWLHLEFRVCKELAGLPHGYQRRFWCDDLIPEEYLFDGPTPKITGRAWIGDTRGNQWEWTFALILPAMTSSLEQMDWASLLPPENMTRWMSFDESRGYIEIEPGVAEPDLA